MQFDDQQYNFSSQSYIKNGFATLDRFCNGFTAINIGTTVATVNGIPLNPGTPGTSNGDSITIGGNKGEILKTRVTISFGAGNTGNVLIIQKFYFTK